jgi:PAS domain S-box-containing protein
MQAVLGDNPSGWLLRRMLPALLVVPLVIGWFGVRGMQEGQWTPRFAVALVVALLVVVLMSITFWAARGLGRAEISLRDTEERHRRLFESTQEMIVLHELVTDAAGSPVDYRITDCNPRFTAITGITRERAVGALASVLYGTPQAPYLDTYAAVAQSGKSHTFETFFAPMEKHFRVSVSSTGPGRFATTTHDFTDRKEAEEALRRSEAHFRQLVSFLPIPLAFYSSRGEVVSVNERFTRVLGYTRDDVSTVDEWFRRAYPDEAYRRQVLKAWTKRVLKVAGTGLESEAGEVKVTCKGGDVRTMAISGVTIGQDLLVTLLDVTEARALQEKLALTERLAAMGTLVAGVAHEINNPLAAVLSGQAWARDILKKTHDEALSGAVLAPDVTAESLGQALEALEDAQEGGKRVASIVKDLTALGRPGAQRVRTDLSSLVGAAMQWLPATVAHRATVRVEDLGAPDVVASAVQIEQVLVNLVTNAANAIPPGKRDVILIRLGPGVPGMARLEVIDRGSGISPVTLRRIFEPFFTTRPVGKGTGLGLSICHAIVAAHGGKLTVESEVGKGSTFRVELPAAPADA